MRVNFRKINKSIADALKPKMEADILAGMSKGFQGIIPESPF
jgi:hypothetical protein